MTTWIEALAKWRAGGGSGKIPSKGSAEYNKVKAMMSGGSAPKEAKAVRPTKSGVARKGTKAGAKFMAEMEKQHFSKPDVMVGPRGGVKKVPKKMPKMVEKAPRKKRADAGMKRGHKKGSKAGDKFMAEMEEKFF